MRPALFSVFKYYQNKMSLNNFGLYQMKIVDTVTNKYNAVTSHFKTRVMIIRMYFINCNILLLEVEPLIRMRS